MQYSYITVLSNWLLGYDRYKKIYSKSLLSRSTYSNEFYLLKENEFDIGLNKATKLIEKINLENGVIYSNNRIIKINTYFENGVKKNTRNGLGWVISQNYIPVASIDIFEDGEWKEISVEDLFALSFNLEYTNLKKYSELTPRSLSFLPVAQACQAKCKFCFSESSISTEQVKKLDDFTHLDYWCKKSKSEGAERFVITGGGEPTILGFDNINKILSISNKYFEKNVLITNGMFLNDLTKEKISSLKSNGLSVLSLSCHHYDEEKNTQIMGANTGIHSIIKEISNIKEKPEIRLVCVLQKGGIDSLEEIENYINFAIRNNITQICFKELYVSSTEESLYSKSKENLYCKNNQISLKLILDYSKKHEKIAELPWGSPIFRILKEDQFVDVAAYTEPSVGWERYHGIARSWNYMADNNCYATLEDMNSLIEE